MLEGIGLIEKTIKNKICWRTGKIEDLQLFNARITALNSAGARGSSNSHGFSQEELSGKAYSGLEAKSGRFAHLPQGVGVNGVVFQTTRPDDPEAYANRHMVKMQHSEPGSNSD